MRGFLAVAAAVCLLAPASARPSSPLADPVLDLAKAHPTLAVDARGVALVQYRTNAGVVRHVLAWGAVNGLAHRVDPSQGQQRFQIDYSGGWKSHKNAQYWQSFRNACRPYDGPELALFVAGCKAPDGSYWALQAWQHYLPMRGFDPWTDHQRSYELHLSHWTGPLPVLEIYQQWTYNGSYEGFFGRMTYGGEPVYGTRGAAVDRFARMIYIDTLDAPKYGAGWRRDTAISLNVRSGGFCYTFVPQGPPGGYPGTPGGYPSDSMRGPGTGEAYRITAMGPGVTPIVRVAQPRIGGFDAARHAELQQEFDQILGGDAHCRAER